MEMRDVLVIVDIHNDKEVEKWKEENNIGGIEEKNVVPKFSLFVRNYKFGDNPDRVETTLLTIRAKKKDARDLYSSKSFLRGHNKFVKTIKCIVIEGLSEAAMWSKAPMTEDPEAVLADHFLNKNHMIFSVKKTNLTTKKGKWFILYKEEDGRCVNSFVNTMLPRVFKDHIPKKKQIKGFKTLTKSSSIQSVIISSYADILKGRAPKSYNQDANCLLECHRKN
eukprot:1009808-Ditylum_brightwellii.AAC.1